MRKIKCICATFLLVVIAVFSSCEKGKNSNKEKLIVQLIDSLNVCKDRCEGERMLVLLDSLKSMDVNTNNGVLYYAVAYAFNGEYDKGIQLLKDSIPSSEKPQLLYHEIGNILLGKGDTTQAIIAYKQALDCNPSYARPYLAMAEVYTKKGEKELAMNNYLAAIRLFAEYDAYEEMGIYAARALKEVDSTNIQMEKFLMYHYIKMNDHRMALAIGLDIDAHCIAQNNAKDGYENRVFMAMSLYELEAYEEAISVMEDAALDETTARDYGYLIYCYVSACYRKLGENEKADDCLKSAMEMDTKAEEYINSLLDR